MRTEFKMEEMKNEVFDTEECEKMEPKMTEMCPRWSLTSNARGRLS